jgi:hypothetical protein
VAAAISIAGSLGLTADNALVLQDSNRLALRLLPCDLLARVAHAEHQVAQLEVNLARQLAEEESPVGALDPRVEPRVYEQDGFAVTLWTYYAPATPQEISPADYASALERLHAGLRKADIPAPHFTTRVEHAQQLVASRDRTPDLADADRELLASTLRDLRRAIGARDPVEQLLHGEPHPGNVLATKHGPLFIDLETCCRGPVEFDLAHAPEQVSAHYPGINQDLLRDCRTLMLAMITTWRWDQNDQLPNGRQLATEWLRQIRAALSRNHDTGRGLLARPAGIVIRRSGRNRPGPFVRGQGAADLRAQPGERATGVAEVADVPQEGIALSASGGQQRPVRAEDDG